MLVQPGEPIFSFYSNFWTNLHHHLHATAVPSSKSRPLAAPQGPATREWDAAVEHYRLRFGKRGPMGLLFDKELVAIHRRLAAQPSDDRVDHIDAELSAHLMAAGLVWREQWPAQDEQNQAFVVALTQLIQRHGVRFQEAVVRGFQQSWPTGQLRVDVSCFAGPVGAYTILDPVHITVSSCDSGYSGDAGLEMIFHEACHALSTKVDEKLRHSANRRGKRLELPLWHGVIFYTAGEIARQLLGDDYIPYATKNRLWGKLGQLWWFDRAWKPYLAGTMSLDEAVEELLDLATQTSSSQEDSPVG